MEIADSRLRNAPRSVSRALTGFRDDYEGGLSVFCCHMLFLLSFYSFLRASEPRGFRDD